MAVKKAQAKAAKAAKAAPAKRAVANKAVPKPAPGKPISKAVTKPQAARQAPGKPLRKASPAKAAVKAGGIQAGRAILGAIPVVGPAALGIGDTIGSARQAAMDARAENLALAGEVLPSGQAAFGNMGISGVTGAVVKQWSTGTANFIRTADGRIHAQRKDGTIKSYRPYRSVVLGKRLTVGQVSRASRKLQTLARSFEGVLRITRPKLHRRKK